VLAQQGNLRDAQTRLEEIVTVSRGTNNRNQLAGALQILGLVLAEQGDLAGARKRLEESQATSNALNQDTADAGVALADLSIEEGRPADAERQSSQIASEQRFRANREREAAAQLALGRALLEQAKLDGARDALARAASLSEKGQDASLRVLIAVESARLRAAKGAASEALKTLRDTLPRATKLGEPGLLFEIRLAIGEIEMRSGHAADGKAHLRELEKEAADKGFQLVARKAARRAAL